MTGKSDRALLASHPIHLEPRYVERIWGGTRFSTNSRPIGEVWLVHEQNSIVEGPGKGLTLADAVASVGENILGSRVWATGERRFPLLVKLIDAREWLSIQVHPGDDLALKLEGPGHRGKTEAWYAIECEPAAEIIAGVSEDLSPEALVDTIRSGQIDSVVKRHPFHAGDVMALPAGTIHALGPGVLIYEIQQSSDTTYRVSDWNRPSSAGRKLHIEQSVAAADSSFRPRPGQVVETGDGRATDIVSLPPFTLQRATITQQPLLLDMAGERFAIVTLIGGSAHLTYTNGQHELTRFDTLVLPAALGSCHVVPHLTAQVLIAWPAIT